MNKVVTTIVEPWSVEFEYTGDPMTLSDLHGVLDKLLREHPEAAEYVCQSVEEPMRRVSLVDDRKEVLIG